jgi:hypothetical protein
MTDVHKLKSYATNRSFGDLLKEASSQRESDIKKLCLSSRGRFFKIFKCEKVILRVVTEL